jgi:amidase
LPKNAKTFIVHMAQAGPLARNLDDLELLWKIIVGPHEREREIAPVGWKNPTKTSLADYKIAWVDGWPEFPVSEEISSEIKKLVEKISQNGGQIENKGPDGKLHDESLRLWMGIFPYVIAQNTPWFIRSLMKKENKSTIFKGWKKHLSEVDKGYKMGIKHYGEMLLLKNQVTASWEYFFKQYDFLLCPMSFGPAFKRTPIGSRLSYDGQDMPYGRYTWPYVACFNASGHPALNLPLGLGKEGLPLGVQIVGPWWSEPELINFARQVTSLTEGFVKPDNF